MNRRAAPQSLPARIALTAACLAALAVASCNEESTTPAAWRLSDAFPSGVSAVYDVLFCGGGHLTNLDEIVTSYGDGATGSYVLRVALD